ncbi:MAG TPA: DNA recombination protein RmuC [Stellaceae bacterium]|nr:DNA recombination protein RmuC [Stellaceae bacterium]
MEIALILVAVVAFVLLSCLAMFYLRAREEAARSNAELAALRRLGENAEQLRQDAMSAMRDAAKAASLETAHSVSSKLLEDHKRETDAAKKEAEARVTAVSAELVRQVDTIAKMVTGLGAQLQEKGAIVDTLKRVLENPASAGAMTEVVLGNTLKSFGLEERRDYVLQFTTADEETGKRLRPDGVVFLPGDNVLVIDCKASKYLLEIAQAEGSQDEAAAYARLAQTMNGHLRALDDKNYRAAVLAARRDAGRGDGAPRVLMMMFLPNDSAMEKLVRADTSFRERAKAIDIVVGGPSALYSALQVAATQISLARQVENHEKIIDRTRDLLDGIAIALSKAAEIGKGLRKAAESFDDFGRSVNRSLLPRARRLVALGMQPNKPVPNNLPSFTVHVEESIIEGEAEELPLPAMQPRLPS